MMPSPAPTMAKTGSGSMTVSGSAASGTPGLMPPTPSPVNPAPANPPTGIPGTTTPLMPDSGIHPTSLEPTPADSGILTVWVPYEAKVTINGMLTKSTGSKRRFVSYGLRPGYTYKYEVKAEIVREGKIQTETQTVSITAGDRGGVAFGFNIPAENLASADTSTGSTSN
jgi:uncharacterized protein (TIGR03000 family)